MNACSCPSVVLLRWKEILGFNGIILLEITSGLDPTLTTMLFIAHHGICLGGMIPRQSKKHLTPLIATTVYMSVIGLGISGLTRMASTPPFISALYMSVSKSDGRLSHLFLFLCGLTSVVPMETTDIYSRICGDFQVERKIRHKSQVKWRCGQ